MRRTVFITWAGILGLILLSACNNRWKALEEGFRTPPDSIRTAVYWYWLDNHISKEGVVKDLEAMKRVGITRAFIGNQSEGDADGPVPLFSDAWWDITHTAMKKAGELGIEIGMFNCPGWSQSGGPWVTPEQSMKSSGSDSGPDHRGPGLDVGEGRFPDLDPQNPQRSPGSPEDAGSVHCPFAGPEE